MKILSRLIWAFGLTWAFSSLALATAAKPEIRAFSRRDALKTGFFAALGLSLEIPLRAAMRTAPLNSENELLTHLRDARFQGRPLFDRAALETFETLIMARQIEPTPELVQGWISSELEARESQEAVEEFFETPRFETIGNPVANPRLLIKVHADFDPKSPENGQYIEVLLDGKFAFSSWASTGRGAQMTPMSRFSPHTIGDTGQYFDKFHNSAGGGKMDIFYPFYRYPHSNGGTHMTEHPDQLGMPASIGCTRLPTFGALAVAKMINLAGGPRSVVLDISRDHPRENQPEGLPPFLQVARKQIAPEWQAEFARVAKLKHSDTPARGRIYAELPTPADEIAGPEYNPYVIH